MSCFCERLLVENDRSMNLQDETYNMVEYDRERCVQDTPSCTAKNAVPV